MKLSKLFITLASVTTLTFTGAAVAAPLLAQAQQDVGHAAEDPSDHVSDAAITAQVQSALLAKASGMQVNVQTNGGVVTLSGEVPSAADIKAIERIVRDVNGVKEVRNELTISGA
ncbi:BON domain-containing protein [Pseudidiomarina insulisalsae]|uniref:Phospholipid-binding protein n=1 Tax=Pseudidiomarina insulisalsae TaxID=575789 RepID=A0A432YMI3_9GAMM|nr:BON domain-containing protein [Pseudidiomarina insulisalsae]RUO62201.1 phospholipid-binding protein [Pseudidiomarina insulisalsae]